MNVVTDLKPIVCSIILDEKNVIIYWKYVAGRAYQISQM